MVISKLILPQMVSRKCALPRTLSKDSLVFSIIMYSIFYTPCVSLLWFFKEWKLYTKIISMQHLANGRRNVILFKNTHDFLQGDYQLSFHLTELQNLQFLVPEEELSMTSAPPVKPPAIHYCTIQNQ